jgi:hypothetical protein
MSGRIVPKEEAPTSALIILECEYKSLGCNNNNYFYSSDSTKKWIAKIHHRLSQHQMTCSYRPKPPDYLAKKTKLSTSSTSNVSSNVSGSVLHNEEEYDTEDTASVITYQEESGTVEIPKTSTMPTKRVRSQVDQPTTSVVSSNIVYIPGIGTVPKVELDVQSIIARQIEERVNVKMTEFEERTRKIKEEEELARIYANISPDYSPPNIHLESELESEPHSFTSKSPTVSPIATPHPTFKPPIPPSSTQSIPIVNPSASTTSSSNIQQTSTTSSKTSQLSSSTTQVATISSVIDQARQKLFPSIQIENGPLLADGTYETICTDDTTKQKYLVIPTFSRGNSIYHIALLVRNIEWLKERLFRQKCANYNNLHATNTNVIHPEIVMVEVTNSTQQEVVAMMQFKREILIYASQLYATGNYGICEAETEKGSEVTSEEFVKYYIIPDRFPHFVIVQAIANLLGTNLQVYEEVLTHEYTQDTHVLNKRMNPKRDFNRQVEIISAFPFTERKPVKLLCTIRTIVNWDSTHFKLLLPR